jgi:UDP-glucose 4-epimerase
MILITGATGFIGSHILEKLISRYGADQVIALTSKKINNVNYLLHNNYDFDDNYLINNGCKDVSTIIHAAAFTPKSAFDANDIAQCNSNIVSTDRLLRQKLPNLKKVVFLSTIDVYENTNDTITESTVVVPGSLYGHSKFYCEGLLRAVCNQKDVDYSILRIGHVYGPGEDKYKKIIPEVMLSILENRLVKLWGDGDDLRSFIYIKDVVEAIVNSLKTREVSEPINVVSDKSFSIKEIVDAVIEVSTLNVEIERIPSNHTKRDLTFNNAMLKKYLQVPEVDMYTGLKLEWAYMKEKYEKDNL